MFHADPLAACSDDEPAHVPVLSRFSRDRDQLDLQRDRLAIGADQAIPRKVAVLDDGDAMLADRQTHAAHCHEAERSDVLLVDVHRGIPRAGARALQAERHRGAHARLTGAERQDRQERQRSFATNGRAHSHSMVAGGLLLTS
jgi:hypothetical protein